MTAPTCAFCGRRIGKGPQSGRAVGTEVFHVSCIQRNGVQFSRCAELERRNRELEDAVAKQAAAAKEARDAEAKWRSVADKAVDAATRHRMAYHAMQASTDQLRSDLSRLQAELVASRAETESARREAALHQAIANRQPVAVATPDPPQTGVEEDASKKRFELLELS